MPKTSIRVDKKLVDEVVKIFNARSRVEAVEMAIKQILDLDVPVRPSKSKIETPTRRA